jgi:hypothetical protein
MTTTEKDAKFRFCPLLTTPDGKLRFCQGSQCMMWRWLGEETGEGASGFCGLASAPVSLSLGGRTRGFLSATPGKDPENPFG